ncbi:hypothetical protein Hdeb2414_s0020g00566081 [Helianthus debilis subsp. tardiflorus]
MERNECWIRADCGLKFLIGSATELIGEKFVAQYVECLLCPLSVWCQAKPEVIMMWHMFMEVKPHCK